MSCAAAREEMLVADLEELRGDTGSGLAMHIRSCDACRARAETLLHAHSAMTDGLARLAGRHNALSMQRKRAAWLWVPLPLAAAAVLALLFVQRQRETLPNVDAVAQLMFRETPLVAPPAGKQAMVIEKNDMTIVWLYNEETI